LPGDGLSGSRGENEVDAVFIARTIDSWVHRGYLTCTIVHFILECILSLVIDTSVIIAVITHEPHRQRLLEITRAKELVAPRSVFWEIGNAFSAMLKQKRITLEQSLISIKNYEMIPLQMVDIDLESALIISERQNIYAYDAYLIACAQKYRIPLLTLDKRLNLAAVKENVSLMEVE